MNLLVRLLGLPGRYIGHGTNHEGEDFVGHLEIEPLAGERAVLLRYRAVRADGVSLHEETTLLGFTVTEELCLWPVMQELPFIVPHHLRVATALAGETPGANGANGAKGIAAVFASGPADELDRFREEIAIDVGEHGELVIAHSWGLPGKAFALRSSCVFHPAEPHP
jgi:hypothetical protein